MSAVTLPHANSPSAPLIGATKALTAADGLLPATRTEHSDLHDVGIGVVRVRPTIPTLYERRGINAEETVGSLIEDLPCPIRVDLLKLDGHVAYLLEIVTVAFAHTRSVAWPSDNCIAQRSNNSTISERSREIGYASGHPANISSQTVGMCVRGRLFLLLMKRPNFPKKYVL